MTDESLRREELTRAVTSGTKRLIVFLTPGYDMRVGGIPSINSIYHESKALRRVHHARVALCVVPGDPLLVKYTWFENDDYLLDLDAVLAACTGLKSLLLHIPEYAVNQVLIWLRSPSAMQLIGTVREVHLNVLVQNIDIVEGQDIAGLKLFGKVTCTTAHEGYTTSATREALDIPLHRLSVFNGAERYSRSRYEDKEHLLIVSHDEHPLKEQVLQQIAQTNPLLRIQVIRDLAFEEYSRVAARAKFALSFGEGLDGYFTDLIWNGGVSFAVFNDRFFTPDFAEIETVYPSWQVLIERISTDLHRFDEPVAYERWGRRPYELLCSLISTEGFRRNLRRFYRGDYTFP